MIPLGSFLFKKQQFFTVLKQASVSGFLKTRLQLARFKTLLRAKSVKAYTGKGNVQQNGQIDRVNFKLVLKNRSNLHLVNLFEIKNFWQRKIE